MLLVRIFILICIVKHAFVKSCWWNDKILINILTSWKIITCVFWRQTTDLSFYDSFSTPVNLYQGTEFLIGYTLFCGSAKKTHFYLLKSNVAVAFHTDKKRQFPSIFSFMSFFTVPKKLIPFILTGFIWKILDSWKKP